MQLSGSNYGMPGIPIERALAFHAELGLGAIELTVLPGYATTLESWTAAERRRVLRLLRDHRIEVSGVADFQSLVDPDPAAAEAILAHHRGAIDLERPDPTPPPIVPALVVVVENDAQFDRGRLLNIADSLPSCLQTWWTTARWLSAMKLSP